jgi:hypothetical protein
MEQVRWWQLWKNFKNMLDFLGVQEAKWDRGGTKPAGEYTFLYENRNDNHELGTDFLCVRESCQQLRGQSLLVIGCCT